jgi:SAM-dependent methyltransferase
MLTKQCCRSKTFLHKHYATFRPTYPAELYRTVLDYHRGHGGQFKLALDLGTGHGEVARNLKPHFDRVVGTDPSAGMIEQAKASSSETFGLDLQFRRAFAEKCDFIDSGESDLITAGQASHWFEQESLWPEMGRIARSGSTLAFWGYKDHVLPQYPKASATIQHFAYSQDPHLLGSYWQQPGRSIVQDKLRKVTPPTTQWTNIRRMEYEPGMQGPNSGVGTPFMRARMKLGSMEEYIRTWSAFHAWQSRFPNKKRRNSGDNSGAGDVVDEMMDSIIETEPELRGMSEKGWRDVEVYIEWGSALILATRK